MATQKCKVCGKPLSPSSGDIGATCKAHAGKLRQSARELDKVPEGWVRMSKVCRAADDAGIGTRAVVKASGGDAAVGPLLDPIFQVVYVGRGKFMNPEVLTKGFELLKKAVSEPKAPKAPKVAEPAKVEAQAVAAKLQPVVK
jgi:hypothetical protein